MDLQRSLAELRRLGLRLDPGEAALLAERRRIRLNTATYPLTRAVGFQLLLAIVVAHNALVFDRVDWGPVLGLALAVEAHVALSWVALRRWFQRWPRLAGWDLGDLSFVVDLALWAAAIYVTGGPRSHLWILPLLRVADHHTAAKVWAFAHLAPLSYGAVIAIAAAAGIPADPGEELLKVALLYVAGLYIAWTGQPARRFREQREAALSAGGALLARLTERTERLDDANRSRSVLVEALAGGIRTSLIEVVGFSRFLLRGVGNRSDAERGYLQRIHDESRRVLQRLDDLVTPSQLPPWPRVSLTGLLQQAAAEEAEDGEVWREAARLELPFDDVETRTDAARLRSLFRHLLAAGRHFQGGPPILALELDPATALPDTVVLRCPAHRSEEGWNEELLNPFSETVEGDQQEMGARLELAMARSIGESLGYALSVGGGLEGLVLTVRLR